jgi:hypothetical protein
MPQAYVTPSVESKALSSLRRVMWWWDRLLQRPSSCNSQPVHLFCVTFWALGFMFAIVQASDNLFT